MAFPSDDNIKITSKLREIDFGNQEGLHFDNLSDKDKQEFNDPNYVAPEGEGWKDVKTRAQKYFANLDQNKSHMVFTHGGLITSYLYDLGVE